MRLLWGLNGLRQSLEQCLALSTSYESIFDDDGDDDDDDGDGDGCGGGGDDDGVVHPWNNHCG